VTGRSSVRRILSSEWESVRTLRAEAVEDPDAPIAFLESPAQVAAHSDEFWQERTRRAAESADSAQFVAMDEDADAPAWVGSLTVLIRRPGVIDHLGHTVRTERGDVVGVFVRPSHRGDGTIDRLFAAAEAWAWASGARILSLDVHADNLRAQAAYRRAGFTPTGETFIGSIGPELVMTRALPAQHPAHG
jgi:GNAT superfamily N-acetyltransferase